MDTFEGSAPDPARWALGATDGVSPLVSVADGRLTLDIAQLAAGRATLLSHSHDHNPFARAFSIRLSGITLSGVGNGTSSAGAYAVLGRHSTDAVGAATPERASKYAVGGGSFAGALGLQVLHYGGAIPWRLQIQDSGPGAVAATNFYLSNPPADIEWRIDGATSTYSIVLSGATFTNVPSGTVITESATVATGSFSHFTEAGLVTAGGLVSRLAVGAINNNTVASRAIASFDAVSVSGSSAPGSPPALPWMIGVNLASAAFAEVFPGVHGTHYIYPGADDLDYFKARGMELIRLPVRWERLQQTLFGPLDSAELARLDAFLDAADERGMRVVPDIHNYARYHLDGVAHIIGSPQVPRAAFHDFWGRLAAHIKDRDCLWAYGLMNEPYDVGAHTWKDTAQVGVDAIRAHDQRRPILIPGDSYSSAFRWPAYSGDLHTLVDPADNLIFEAHQYLDADHSGTGNADYGAEGAYPAVGVDRLAPFIQWLQLHGLRGYIGEFGVPDNDPRWAVALDNMVAHMKANNLPGTYWAAGPRWGDYQQRANLRPNHDESPQMQVMVPHATGPGTAHWPSFTWYADAVTPGSHGAYTYQYKSDTAVAEVNFADTAVRHSGSRAIRFSYTIPPGGWAGGGLHINGGVNLTRNFLRRHVLSFHARGTAGSAVRVFLVTDDDVISAKVPTTGYATLDNTWRKISIPLDRFLTAGLDGTQRIRRVAFEGLPADNTAHVVHLDHFIVEKPDSTPPSVTLDTATGATTFPRDAAIPLVVAASDASGVDFVEILVNGDRRALLTAAPYVHSLSLPPGTHRITAIAWDEHGNPARSAPKTVTVAEGHASFLDWRRLHFTAAELADATLKPSRWGLAADPDRDGLSNLLEYTLGTHPLVPDPGLAPLAVLPGAPDLVVRYRRAKQIDADPRVALEVQSTADLALGPWTSLAAAESLHADFGDFELRDIPLPAPDPARFVRLRATFSP